MKKIDKLTVKYQGQTVGRLSLTPDDRLCAFEYDAGWLANGFSISPLELPLKPGLFIARPTPFYGNFGIFEDSLPDGYGRYLLHKVLLRNGINDSDLSSDGQRHHVATAGGLLCISLSNPVLDYSNLLALTGFLTQSHERWKRCFVAWYSII